MTPVEWILLFILGGVWGGTFFFNAIAIPEIPPLVVIFFRVAIASIILWVVVLAGGIKVPRDATTWVDLVIMAALNSALPFFLIAWGQVHIASGLASIMIGTTPLFAVVTAHFMTSDEKMSPGKVLGVLAGLVGVVVLIGPQFLGDIGKDLIAQLSVLGAAVCYAVSAIYGRRFSRRDTPPMMVATGQITMAAVLLLPFALIIDRPWELAIPSMQAGGAVLGLAVLSTSFAYLIFFRILARAGAVNILLVNFLVPVSAILLGVFILGEVLTTEQIVGMAFIALGLALIDGRLFQRRRAA
ncbi:MAG: DMT family transporter [Rhodospirillaceae bacterium]|nr:DMT family transporter [Rhodospirillaceae bacterium]MBT4771108.1 DMT family transporter [Rhodospirillaceae bacterium]MBT5357733.1 DMT family transporter [Rhodospirillaceae bacterium]MBT5768149.1 DMT family transporter [Rhodospirillaceae bacterium]MBT6308887.1 DMT family transporter [Rhodospirillaceae bacterium]